MSRIRRIAIIGDLSPEVPAHRIILQALNLSGETLGIMVHSAWLESRALRSGSENLLPGFAGIWVTPGSPYQSTEGVLDAIRFAREHKIPFLGTCGGFQHALVEHARNVLGVTAADHAENNPGASEAVVAPLSCPLVEQSGDVVFRSGSRLREIMGSERSAETYHCRFGLDSRWRARLEAAGLAFSAFDENGEVRAFETPGHPFFVGTLFQPERSALVHQAHPIITAFVAAAMLGD